MIERMVFNGSELINQPWNTTFSPFFHLFSMVFFIIPITFIGASLFVKTRDTPLTSLWFVIGGSFLMGASAFNNAPGAVIVYLVVTMLGIAVLLYSVFYGGK